MKAAIRKTYGSPSQLSIEKMDRPAPNDYEVLIKVYATTANRTDYAVVTGKPFIMRFFTGLFKPKLAIPGTDFAGKIIATGKKVQSFKPGDKVFGFKDDGLASQATYMCFPADGEIIAMPDNIDFETAAASLEGAHYAYNSIKKVPIRAGQKVLVNGATGAIGSALLQMLKYFDVYVTAVCNTKNIELIRSLGADKIIDYTKEDFTNDEDQYDYIFDAVGKSTFFKCQHLLKKNGVYMSTELGPMAQNIFLALIPSFLVNKRVIFPVPSNIKESLIFITMLIKKRKFDAVIDRIYPLEQISEAYQYVATGEKTGNVVITMTS